MCGSSVSPRNAGEDDGVRSKFWWVTRLRTLHASWDEACGSERETAALDALLTLPGVGVDGSEGVGVGDDARVGRLVRETLWLAPKAMSLQSSNSSIESASGIISTGEGSSSVTTAEMNARKIAAVKLQVSHGDDKSTL